LARYFVPQARFRELTEALATQPADVDAVVARFAVESGKSRLAAKRPAIDRCFGHDTVEAIVSALRKETGEWASQAVTAMQRASPLSLKLALRILRQGAGMEIEDALSLEYRAMMHVIADPDFYEGVRSVLIDKDQKPRWTHPSLADVSEGEVERHFESLGDRELRFELDGSSGNTHARESRP
jgi:enoyl-CoA hydratase